MESDVSLSSKSSTTRSPSPPRWIAYYTPSPEHWVAPGIPARDLTAEEVEHFGLEALRNAQCYELVEVESLEELAEGLDEE